MHLSFRICKLLLVLDKDLKVKPRILNMRGIGPTLHTRLLTLIKSFYSSLSAFPHLVAAAVWTTEAVHEAFANTVGPPPVVGGQSECRWVLDSDIVSRMPPYAVILRLSQL